MKAEHKDLNQTDGPHIQKENPKAAPSAWHRDKKTSRY